MEFVFVGIIFVYFTMALYFAIKNNVNMIKFFLCVIFMQNIVCIIFAPYVSSGLITLFSLIKELMLYLAFFISVTRKRRIRIDKGIAISVGIFFALLIKNLLMSSAGVYSGIISFRFLIVPMICVAVGYSIKNGSKSVVGLCKFIVKYASLLAVSGIVELILLRDRFWESINYSYYAVNIKGNLPWTLRNGVTENFYTFDFGLIPVRRMVTITADPLASAFLMFLGAAIIYIGFVSMRKKGGMLNQYFVYFVLLIVCSLLVLSKAVFVFIPIVLFVITYFKGRIPKALLKPLATIGGFGGITLIIWYAKTYGGTGSAITHVLGLVNGFSISNILGNGLGTAGVSAAMIAGEDVSSAESYIGTLSAQMGVIATISFMAFCVIIITRLEKIWKQHHSKFTLLAISLLCGLIMCMLFSESSVSISGTGIYFMLIGMALNQDVYE